MRAGCKLLRANCQSKYQHCGGSLQSCAEKNIRFDCNCPYKGHPCLSAKFCGDLNKHKGEKDSLSAVKTELQAAKKSLCKLENTLSSKVALKNQTTSSFSSVVRLRLINERKSRYISSQGFENWRQINIDIKKLEAYFRRKIPSDEESLIDALKNTIRSCNLLVCQSLPATLLGLCGNLRELNGPHRMLQFVLRPLHVVQDYVLYKARHISNQKQLKKKKKR